MTIKDQLDGLLELADELKQNVRYIAEDLGVDLGEDGEDETASPESRVKLHFAEGVTPEELREALGYYRGLNDHRYSVETQVKERTEEANNAVMKTVTGEGDGETYEELVARRKAENSLTSYEESIVESGNYSTVEDYLREKLGKDPSDAGSRRLANSILNSLPLAVDARNPEVFSDNRVYFAKEMLNHVWDKFYKDRPEISW